MNNEWLYELDNSDRLTFLDELINASMSDGFVSSSPNNKVLSRLIIEKWYLYYNTHIKENDN